MTRSLDWEKARRRELGRTNPYQPEKSKKVKGPSGAQTKLIAELRRQAGVPRGPMPKTAQAASAEIKSLKAQKKDNEPRVKSLYVPQQKNPNDLQRDIAASLAKREREIQGRL